MLMQSRVINIEFPLQTNHKYNIARYEELGFSKLTQMKDDYILPISQCTDQVQISPAASPEIWNWSLNWEWKGSNFY